ncbi:tape measure protein [Pseudomonas sp. EggHat1]|uniref:tape measure protein n=1 Tax=Pseudomonas sp. EggHat1 TaxID=2761624 RepID=UPI001866027B|nr:tape measure protein [Pseudomonas sp. EggHat1]
MSRVRTQLVIDGKNNSKQAFDEVRKDLDSLDKRIAQAGQAVVGYLSVQTLVGALRTIASTSDAWVEMTDRIKLATRSDEEYAESLDALRKISDRTFTNMTNNAEVYINSLSVLRERGFSNREALQFTETIGLGLVASAAKGERATQVINQFSKALQQGKLQGDSFNAMVESAPALTDALARGLGKTREELARMATDGKLTTDVFVPALLSQMDSLGSAVDGMNITVGDALTRLQNAWNAAIGGADVSPLVEAIQEVTKTVSDPAVVDGIVKLAGALVTLAEWTIKAGANTATLGQDLGYIAARLTGNVDEISRAEKEIEKFQAAADGFGVLDLYMTDEQINQGLAQWKAYHAELLRQQTGFTEEQRKNAEENRKQQDASRDADLAGFRQYTAEIKRLQGETVKATQDAIKQQVQAEKAAQRDLEKVRDDRLKIEQRYQQAMTEIMSGGQGEPSLIDFMSLRGAARNAVSAGDAEGAQRQAQAALQVLRDLAAAGESTAGFSFFIRELQEIELAANDIEKTRAEDKITAIGVSIAALKDQASQLEGMPVSVTADEASIEAVRAQIQSLAAQLGSTEIVLPVKVSLPGEPTSGIPGFATGTNSAPPGMAWVGERGPELVVFGGGERVLTAAASQNLMSRMQGLAVQDLAGGSAAELAASVPGATPGRDLGRVTLNVEGQRYEMLAEPQPFEQILRRQRVKFGRPRS